MSGGSSVVSPSREANVAAELRRAADALDGLLRVAGELRDVAATMASADRPAALRLLDDAKSVSVAVQTLSQSLRHLAEEALR